MEIVRNRVENVNCLLSVKKYGTLQTHIGDALLVRHLMEGRRNWHVRDVKLFVKRCWCAKHEG